MCCSSLTDILTSDNDRAVTAERTSHAHTASILHAEILHADSTLRSLEQRMRRMVVLGPLPFFRESHIMTLMAISHARATVISSSIKHCFLGSI